MSSAEPVAVKEVSFLLHAHLPFAIRPELDFSLEEAWLHEAIINCYLPLIDTLREIKSAKSPRLTLSLSPTLLELWALPDLTTRFRSYLDKALAILETDGKRDKKRREQGEYIRASWLKAESDFEAINGDLTNAFVKLAIDGKIELITTAATHAFLPAFQSNQAFRELQIATGIKCFRKRTGITPKGFWLPECGYFPGIEDELKRHDIQFFAIEANKFRVKGTSKSTSNSTACENGVYALARDSELSKKVWSARSGYPGAANYRDFHKDGIHEIDTKSIGQFALPDGQRISPGLKYWRVTGEKEKCWYSPKDAKEQARSDAHDFVTSIERRKSGRFLLPFDAELFGHWWHEGPLWLENVFKIIDESQNCTARSISSSLERNSTQTTIHPLTSSWGRNSDASFWVNHDTDWIYPMLSDAFEQLRRCTLKSKPTKRKLALLNQATRELLVASASDWPFMISAGTTKQLAEERVEKHLKRFYYTLSLIERKKTSSQERKLLEKTNPIFQDIDLVEILTKSIS